MKRGMIIFFFLVGVPSGLADEKKTEPQACKEEATMVSDYQKGLADLVGTVQKESLAEFERTFHRRSTLSKLNLSESVLGAAMECFDQALKDSASPKGHKEAYQAKRDGIAKLREKLIQYRTTLKAKEEGKDSKALIETFALAD